MASIKRESRTKLQSLTAISPVDGRYRGKTEELSQYFSEYALVKTRLEVEIKYLIFLSKISVAPKINKKSDLQKIYKDFSIKDAKKVKEIEKETNHDIKAVEYFIASRLKSPKLAKLRPFVHFALTSNDINNLSYRLMIKRALSKLLLPELDSLIKDLSSISHKHAKTVMLARTHGQAAVPTTFGKEIAVSIGRLKKQLKHIKSKKLEGKFGGAVGNWSAHVLAFPEMDWVKLSEKFLESLGFSHSKVTTQIAPPEDILDIFQHLALINAIIYDLDQNMWRYISDGWITKKLKEKEIGSSVMPQKVNPINFENSEGNIEIANGLLATLTRTLPVSRLQRDLSDSTIMRNIGSAFAHSLIAYRNTAKGLGSIKVNEKKMKQALTQNWNILSAGLQTILKREGYPEAYEKIAAKVKGKIITEKAWKEIVTELNFSPKTKRELKKLNPEDYIGYASKLAEV